MTKRIAILLLVIAPALFGQEVPREEGDLLSIGRTATLGVEASTAFAWDVDKNQTGLETKAGMELILPLFPHADRGMYPDTSQGPAVRLAIKNMSFTWLNIYQTRGGNYEQDDFNTWTSRPLVLTFDSFEADLVWKHYFFRVASSTTVFRTTQASLFSIFDDVMDARERWYVFWPMTQALWTADRYNIQQLPLLRGKLARDFIDEDYRNLRTRISGILAGGVEFDKFSAVVKVASRHPGVATTDPVQPANTENAWLFGIDFAYTPIHNLLFEATGFAGINYEKTDVLKNPANFGISAEYRYTLSDRYFLTPKAGFDFSMDTAAKTHEWEIGAGVVFNTRGYDFLTSSRILDWDDVIPVGASLSMNMNNDNVVNMLLSWFEPAGPDSILPNFGGFLQFELADVLNNGIGRDYGILAQIEYLIADKITPYIRGGYIPQFRTSALASTATTGNYITRGALGCYVTPVHFFSMDIRYEMDVINGEIDKNIFSTVFTIRM